MPHKINVRLILQLYDSGMSQNDIARMRHPWSPFGCVQDGLHCVVIEYALAVAGTLQLAGDITAPFL